MVDRIIAAPKRNSKRTKNALEKRRTMNERLSGVYVYGGGPQQHYVFRGETQRRRKLRAITLVLAAIFAILLAGVVRLTYLEVAQPQVASAEAP